MHSYNTFFGFYALSNTPMWLDYEENNRIKKILIYGKNFIFFFLVFNSSFIGNSYNSNISSEHLTTERYPLINLIIMVWTVWDSNPRHDD